MTTKGTLLRQLALASFAVSTMVVGCTEVTDAAFVAYAEEVARETYPEATSRHPVDVHEVRPGYGFLKGDRLGIAVNYSSGRSEIYIDETLRGHDRQGIALHEWSHVISWRLHGEKIPAHGRKFQRVCRNLADKAGISRDYCKSH